jgi:hypothetical protein
MGTGSISSFGPIEFPEELMASKQKMRESGRIL